MAHSLLLKQSSAFERKRSWGTEIMRLLLTKTNAVFLLVIIFFNYQNCSNAKITSGLAAQESAAAQASTAPVSDSDLPLISHKSDISGFHFDVDTSHLAYPWGGGEVDC